MQQPNIMWFSGIRLRFSVDSSAMQCLFYDKKYIKAVGQVVFTERCSSVVIQETRIREAPGSNPGGEQLDWGFFLGFPQSSTQMLGWIFNTTIHLTIIHRIHIS